jgi:hypothetical protein
MFYYLTNDGFLSDTIEKAMRSLFEIPSQKETRLWNKYLSNTYEQLNKPDSTVQDAGLFQGQVCRQLDVHHVNQCNVTLLLLLTHSDEPLVQVDNLAVRSALCTTCPSVSPPWRLSCPVVPQVLVIERKNEDGTWPRQSSHSK